MGNEKLKFAFSWNASCGGCEIAVLDIDEKILDVLEKVDILFWPVAMDFKKSDLESYEDKSIDVGFYNGAVRTSEQEEYAHLMRRKSKVLIAFGSCAHLGGIPGLANVSNREGVFQKAYVDTFSTVNPSRVFPQTESIVNGKKLTLPEFYDDVKALGQVVDVDYYVPGCPPPPDLIVKAIDAIVSGELPPKGTVLANEKALCEECPRKKGEKKIRELKRVHEAVDDGETCLLEQGIICLGPVTRGGCGSRCINANMPCRGCFGPVDKEIDMGASMLSALASVIDEDLPMEEQRKIVESVEDPLCLFYRFSLPVSLFRRVSLGGDGDE
jgi:F420-non-reducing hydrogenase small subunit